MKKIFLMVALCLFGSSSAWAATLACPSSPTGYDASEWNASSPAPSGTLKKQVYVANGSLLCTYGNYGTLTSVATGCIPVAGNEGWHGMDKTGGEPYCRITNNHLCQVNC